MKTRIFLVFVITLILLLVLWSNGFAQDADKRLEKIKTQIHILNLLNGLELDHQQMQLILRTAKEAQEIRYKTKEAMAQKEEMLQAYQEVLRVAKTGSLSIPQDIAFRVRKVNQEVDGIRKVAQEKM